MTLDKTLVEALEKDYTTAPITAQERVMVDYVVKLTKDATKVWKDDIEGLRTAGFDAFLIGESLMRQTDVAAATRALIAQSGTASATRVG